MIRRLWSPLPHNSSAFWRVAFDFGFAASSLVNGFGAERPDVIIAVCPPVQVALTAAMLGARWRVPTCLWVKDLALNAAVDVGMLSRDSLAYRLGDALERFAYGRGSQVVVLHEKFDAVLSEKGVPAAHLATIPNLFMDSHVGTASQAHRSLMGADNREFLILHAGNMGAKQDLGNVVAAAKTMRPEDPIKFAIVGDGSRRAWLESEVLRSGLARIAVLPLQPANEIPNLYASADALLINQGAGVIDSVVPMKLLSYLAAGRPILAAVHPKSVTSEIIRDAECGVQVSAGDPQALADGARELARCGDPERLGRNARKYAEKNFAAGPVITMWEELLTGLTVGTGALNGASR